MGTTVQPANLQTASVVEQQNAPRSSAFAWLRRFLRNKGAMGGFVMLLAWTVIALLGARVAPYDPSETLDMARQAAISGILVRDGSPRTRCLQPQCS